MYSGIGSGLLGLEMPLHPQQQPQASQNPQSLHLHHQSHQLSAFGAHGGGDQSGKLSSSYAFASNPKPTTPNSDEDEGGGGDPKRKMSPWQRMKWTDNMVRLLIMAVYYIGDEVGSESSDPAGKKKPAGGGLLQKKGKWKSVSRAMMEKGFYVSPQQCEDKFNDLNKRYKRVNDILGRGTACRVVENQTLLETMEIPPKMKEEARKLLNSKHLFFREMCAYHNSCGHGTGTPPPPPAGPAEIAANEPPSLHLQPPTQPLCYHTSQMAVNSSRNEGEAVKLIKAGSDEDDEEEDDDDDDDDDDEESEDESEDEDMEEATDQCRGHGGHGHNDNTTTTTTTNTNNNNESPHSHSHSHSHSSQKRQRKGGLMTCSSLMGQLNSEVGSMMQDGAKSEWEKQQWVRMRLRQLEEQQVKYEYQALELEKQRLKWIKFSSKKEREMEKAKLENQRRRLETERMALFVRHKEMELLDHHHQQQHEG